jgi:hypothetical protein
MLVPHAGADGDPPTPIGILSVIAWFQQLTVRLAQGRFMKIAEAQRLAELAGYRCR